MLPTFCPHCRTRLDVDIACEGRPVLCGVCREVFTAWCEEPRRVARGCRTWDDEDDWDRPRRRSRRTNSESATFSLVLGIVSACIFCFWPVGLITSAVGMTLGAKALNTPSRPTAVTGLVLSTVGMIFAVGFAVLTVALIAKLGFDDGLGAMQTQPTSKKRR